MGRAKPEWVEFARKEFTVSSHSVVTHLFEHIDAIELELKISKEDEERIAKAAERMTDNIAQLQMNFNNAREMVKDQTDRADFLEQERQRLQGEVFTLNQQLYGDLEKTEFKLTLKENERLKGAVEELRKKAEKVALPKEVAAALEDFKNEEPEDKDDVDYLIWKIPRLGFRNNVSKSMRILDDYACKKTFTNLVDALRYGYTVEQTKEERLREGIGKIINEWYYGEAGVTTEGAAERVTDFVTKFNAEN